MSYALVILVCIAPNLACAPDGDPKPMKLDPPDKVYSTPYECAVNGMAFAAQSGVAGEGSSFRVRCVDSERVKKKE